MRTLTQALIDEIGYPIGEGFATNRLIARGLCPAAPAEPSTIRGAAFQGATADCLVALVRMPNITEGDYRIDLSDRGLLLRHANAIYRTLGEPTIDDKPKDTVTIGW